MKFEKLMGLFKKGKPKKLFVNTWDSDDSPIHWRLIEEKEDKKKDDRIEKRPIEVFEEIISEKPIIDLANLDEKIKIVKERMRVLTANIRSNDFAQEKNALIYLQARKKYKKFGGLFNWSVTNNELIERLCKKYKVRSVGIDNYYRNIPMEGINEIKKFGEAVKRIDRNLEPEFKLIIDDKGKETRKDPILLALSPFGNWYYVLGAWDKEVEIIDDLIYKRK